ncbi:hypothetical protein M0R89_10285 [Halorussus limi]|uniref:Uncharacterized protein n=1 Tax=Halorussus limi TaxID=2938695 RepID=A0A8U0HPG0_9EURY|nr:hypothetical protein [Halorussus limi]UPV72935.1 hypothetical protein M0R89_10285 [Halorussus limi]
MRRREFLRFSAVSLFGLQSSHTTQLVQAQSELGPDVSATIINTVDAIRENTDFEKVDVKKSIDKMCSSYSSFAEKAKTEFRTLSSNNSLLRYVARTTADVLHVLQDTLGLDLSPLEDTVGIRIADNPVSSIASTLEDALSSFDNALRSISSLVPVAGSLFGMVENGCAYDRFAEQEKEDKAEEAKEDFLICAVMLLLDLLLIYTGGTYKIAFRGTRKIANTLLVRIRSLIGFDAYSIVMKTVYWLVHGTVENSPSLIAEEIDETETTLEGVDIDYNESEFLEVGYDQTDKKQLQRQTNERDRFDDEDSSDDILDDDGGKLFDLPSLSEWGNGKDDRPWVPG